MDQSADNELLSGIPSFWPKDLKVQSMHDSPTHYDNGHVWLLASWKYRFTKVISKQRKDNLILLVDSTEADMGVFVTLLLDL